MEESRIGSRVWGPWPTVGFGIAVLTVYGITQGISAIVIAVVRATASGGSLDPMEFAGVVAGSMGLLLAVSVSLSAVVGLAAVAGVIKLGGSSVAEYLALRSVPGKTLLVLLGVSGAFAAMSDGLTVLLGRPLVPEYMLDAYTTSPSPLLLGAAVVIFAPAFEETFFRGFLFAGLRQSRIGVAGAIVLISLVWAAIHIQYGMYELATIFVLGIVLGIARFKTGSLWAPLLMHAFTNLYATVETALIVNGLLG